MTNNIDRLISNSSFGTPAARALRRRTPDHVIDRLTAALDHREESLIGPHTRPSAGHNDPPQRTNPKGTKTMTAKQRTTSAKAAKAASKVLRDGRTSSASKTAAGSALSQRAPKRSK